MLPKVYVRRSKRGDVGDKIPGIVEGKGSN